MDSPSNATNRESTAAASEILEEQIRLNKEAAKVRAAAIMAKVEEAKRLSEEKRQAEEAEQRRMEEEARVKREAEERRRAEEEERRAAEEAARVEAERSSQEAGANRRGATFGCKLLEVAVCCVFHHFSP